MPLSLEASRTRLAIRFGGFATTSREEYWLTDSFAMLVGEPPPPIQKRWHPSPSCRNLRRGWLRGIQPLQHLRPFSHRL